CHPEAACPLFNQKRWGWLAAAASVAQASKGAITLPVANHRIRAVVKMPRPAIDNTMARMNWSPAAHCRNPAAGIIVPSSAALVADGATQEAVVSAVTSAP